MLLPPVGNRHPAVTLLLQVTTPARELEPVYICDWIGAALSGLRLTASRHEAHARPAR